MDTTLPSTVQPSSAHEVGPFRDRLSSIYRETDAAVAVLGPACALSGRCCRFHEADHALFVSAPEAALLLADAPPPSRPLDDGATCPWQSAAGLCTAREARPVGCRVYYCDAAYLPHAPAIAEAAIARLREMVDDLGLDWGYAPLHHHLRRAAEEGRFPRRTTPNEATPSSRGVGIGLR